MQYRILGARVEEAVSALGYGCMRLPTLGASERIDRELAVRLLRSAVDEGVNYVDTAYSYHEGMSERLVGEALADGYRERVLLATKMPVWLVEGAADFDRYLHEQLCRLSTDYLDVYLLHSLNRERWEKVAALDVLDWAVRKREEGTIRYIGFSFHGPLRDFRQIIDAWGSWDLCQIQYNFMNVAHQAGHAGLHYAAERGVGVVIMEPLLGGVLAAPPEPVRRMWEEHDATRRPAEWAFRWLWSQPEVGTVLSGMGSLRDVEENLLFAERSSIEPIPPEELVLYEQVRRGYESLSSIPCTTCEYCLPCPNGIDIPGNFSIYNTARFQDQIWFGQAEYERKPEAERAGSCQDCGECLEKCPQEIAIPERLREVHSTLSFPGEG